jgi:GNAT superfamily N-acetyltransferase
MSHKIPSQDSGVDEQFDGRLLGPSQQPITIRRITAADRDNYRRILDDTTDEDRYCRFFHAVDHFDPDFIDVYVRERRGTIGFIALNGEPLGTAHAIAIDELTAELAVVVARKGRRRGIARALLEQVVADAKAQGYKALVAYALRQNVAFNALAVHLGMQPDSHSDGSTIIWKLSL